MRAIQYTGYGDSSVLQLVDVPEPQPAAHEVLVKIIATGINFIEIYRREGIYPVDLPHIPGDEGMGVVESVGEAVTHLKVGDRVAFCESQHTYAEYSVVAEDKALRIPDEIDDLTAAALPLQGMTAHYLSHSTVPLGPDHTVLMHAGAGGVGLLLTQLAVLRGATVFTTVSTAEKAQLARDAGAHEVLGYEDFDSRIHALTQGRGVDVVYDGVGKATFDRSLESLALRGTLVLFGAASGPVPPFDLQRLNSGGSLFITRPSLLHYIHTPQERQQRWKDLTAAVVSGQLNVRIGETFPLEEASLAHDALSGRQTTGKVLLVP